MGWTLFRRSRAIPVIGESRHEIVDRRLRWSRLSEQFLALLSDRLVVFALGDQRYGLTLSAVERIVRAVAVTSLPQAPDIVLGIVNVQGRVIPVINLRRRFRLAEREIDLSDQMVIARTARRTVALVVDAVIGVLGYAEQEAGQESLPELRYIEGVVKLDDGLILIHDLDKFLSLEEEAVLHLALESAEGG